MAPSTSSLALGPSHCPPLETVSLLPSPVLCSWLSTASVTLGPAWPGPSSPLLGDHAPGCGHTLGSTAEGSTLPCSLPTWPRNSISAPAPSQVYSCRPLSLGLGVSTFHSAAGKGSPSLSDSSPPPGLLKNASSSRQLEPSGSGARGVPASGGLRAAQVPASSAQISSGVRGARGTGEWLLDLPKSVCQDPAYPSPTQLSFQTFVLSYPATWVLWRPLDITSSTSRSPQGRLAPGPAWAGGGRVLGEGVVGDQTTQIHCLG